MKKLEMNENTPRLALDAHELIALDQPMYIGDALNMRHMEAALKVSKFLAEPDVKKWIKENQ